MDLNQIWVAIAWERNKMQQHAKDEQKLWSIQPFLRLLYNSNLNIQADFTGAER